MFVDIYDVRMSSDMMKNNWKKHATQAAQEIAKKYGNRKLTNMDIEAKMVALTKRIQELCKETTPDAMEGFKAFIKYGEHEDNDSSNFKLDEHLNESPIL